MNVFQTVSVKSLNDLPDGIRLRLPRKFIIIGMAATYTVKGNRVKLKRAWIRWSRRLAESEYSASKS